MMLQATFLFLNCMEFQMYFAVESDTIKWNFNFISKGIAEND